MSLTQKEVGKLWELVKMSLSKKFAPDSYKAWIEHSTKLVEVRGDVAKIVVLNKISLNWINKHAVQVIQDIFKDIIGGITQIEYIVDKSFFNTERKEEVKPMGPLLDPDNAYESKFNKAIVSSGLNPKFTFESFVVGRNSQIAHAAGQAIAQSPGGQDYNPLFIYGSVGVGKTHLMHAIGITILQKNPERKVYYCSSEAFLNSLVEAIKTRKTSEFRDHYRKLDVLMVDDIQLISRWESVKEELFHTFNILYGAGKQIIFASDRPPAQIPNIEDRLRSRFEGGMLADITPPDYETRLVILNNYNLEHNPQLSQECLEAIASMVEDNIRQLIGAYNKVFTFAKVTQTELDRISVERIIGTDLEQSKRKVKVEDILEKVADAYGVTVGMIKSDSRTASIVLPRQISMFLIRDILNYPLERVAQLLRRSDHTTVIHAVDKVKKMMLDDHNLRTQVVGIKNTLLR